MGAKVSSRRAGQCGFIIVPGVGEVAQVAHPVNVDWELDAAVDLLLKAGNRLAPKCKMVITGGGFIRLTYQETSPPLTVVRQGHFLTELIEWTKKQALHKFINTVVTGRKHREYIIGVDVLSGDGSWNGQFALWIGETGAELVAKRFPVNDEITRVAGITSDLPVHGPRILKTVVGKSLLLVCHDAQAFNHRNRKNVEKATWLTPRKRAIREFDNWRKSRGLQWAFNLVHRIAKPQSTRTFVTSYSQIRNDFPNNPLNVVGSFGYEGVVSPESALELLGRMTSPNLDLPKIVLHVLS